MYTFSGTTSEKRTYSSDDYREPDVVTGSEGSNFDNEPTYLGEMNDILGTKFTNSDNFKKYINKITDAS